MSEATSYPAMKKLIAKGMGKFATSQPAVMEGFRELHKAGVAPGALDGKTKELIALAISVAVRCDGCIAFHVSDALKANASEAEIMDALGVAVLMGGGPAMMYASHAIEALEQYTNA